MSKTYNILLCGVGGQGIILASKLLSEAALLAGYDIKQSEVHGMSQRGGSVVSYIRLGEKIYSPLIAENTADFIVSFEKMETLRYLSFANKNTIFIIADLILQPISVNIGKGKYPENIEKIFNDLGYCSKFIDVYKTAKEIGNLKTINVITLAALAQYLPIADDIWFDTFKKILPTKILDINLLAFKKIYKKEVV